MKPTDLVPIDSCGLPREPGIFVRASARGVIVISLDAMAEWPQDRPRVRADWSASRREIWMTPCEAGQRNARKVSVSRNRSKMARISFIRAAKRIKLAEGQYPARWEDGCLVVSLGPAEKSDRVAKLVVDTVLTDIERHGRIVVSKPKLPSPPSARPGQADPHCGNCLMHFPDKEDRERTPKCQDKASDFYRHETPSTEFCLHYRPGVEHGRVTEVDVLSERSKHAYDMGKVEYVKCPECSRDVMVIKSREGPALRKHVKSPRHPCPSSGRLIAEIEKSEVTGDK